MESQRTSSAHRTWDLPDSAVTPEACYLRRREFLRVFGLGLAASALLPPGIQAESGTLNDPLNPSYKLDGVKLTPEDLVTSYNNFYEWGLAKGSAERAGQSRLENSTVVHRNRRIMYEPTQA
jgi:methionine sulfoxide reductase catalytic subunit